ncbi:MAG: hypothetical protein ISS15_17230 [Alphaproteobacteria bacterium]|nr:hypothetical protein [Alphaproteobacteria bacterium]MBL6937769.1 hypothetical protein [Alphaproteobacteria bacterium]MBL7099405.1 hypothetical protein [Alphaproteobacteria bacterium]
MTIRRVLVVATMLGAAATAATAAPPKGWKTYTDAKNGWSISYPANFTVDPKYQSIEIDPPVHGVSFSIPESYTKGTNLDDALVAVEVLPGKNCKPAQFLSDPEEVKTLKADGRTYVTAFMPDSGMMQQRSTNLFLISGTCTAVTYFVHSTERTVIDPPPKQYDDARLTKLFDSIRATFTLKK